MNFIQQALCESNGNPSSTRVNLLILLLFTMGLVIAAFIVGGELPEIPESLERLIEFLFGIATSKVMIGGIADAAKAIFAKGTDEAKNGAD